MEDQEHITPIDQHVIDFVLGLRTDKNHSQEQIATLLGVKRSFIGNVESTNNRAKYNIRHINILADYFDISPRDFLPASPLAHYYPERDKRIIGSVKKPAPKAKSAKAKSAKAKSPTPKKVTSKKKSKK